MHTGSTAVAPSPRSRLAASARTHFDRFMNEQRVRGVLVLQDGKIRLERYASPHSAATRWNSFSVAKSITSTLVGAAMKDGYIQSLDDPRHALHQRLARQRI